MLGKTLRERNIARKSGTDTTSTTRWTVADTALLVIATGERYHRFIEPLLESARKYFVPHDSVLWTDSTERHSATIQIQKPSFGFPKETLYRYGTFLKNCYGCLDQYEHLFYVDVDSRFVAPVDPSILVENGLVATLHPGFVGTEGTPERRLESHAYIAPGSDNKYFCGGFNGGSTLAYLCMAIDVNSKIILDDINGITPVWHDESMLNRFLFDHPPAKVLSPSYCSVEGSPDPRYPPILVALSKGWCRTCGAATKPHVNDCGRHRA
jgi:Glycosyltransferase family 6